MTNSQESKRPIPRVEPGPIRHAKLPKPVVERIEGIATILSDVDPRPVEEWVEDFQRDLNPEKEILIWEVMAATYSLFIHGRGLSGDAKKEAFKVILQRSMADAKTVKKNLELIHLSRSDLKEILRRFSEIADAKEVKV